MTAGSARAGRRSGAAIAALLVLGAVAVVLAASPYTAFDLDRHAVPKELALHLTALLAGGAALLTHRRETLRVARVDQFLGLYLGGSAISALFTTNHWLSFRALAISVSGAVCYWAARRAAALGTGALVRGGVAFAVALGAATALLQAYGVQLPIFAESRAPGGTFGNRNFVAHVAAVGLPLLVALVLGVRRAGSAALATVGVMLVAAILFLSRSRAAWLGAASGLGVLTLWALAGARPAFDAVRRRRLTVLAGAMAGSLALAALLPNALAWKSRSPYAETARNLVDARSGSGRGRLIQYRNTLQLIRQDPLLGVGPGNWAVRYPTVTQPGDPAYVPTATVPTNPWPSSDWVALVSERGAFTVLCLFFAFIGLGMRAWRTARSTASPARADAWGAAGMAAALVTVGCFDAVLLNAAPSLLALTAFGALVPVTDAAERRRAVPRWMAILLAVVVIGGVVRSGQGLAALGRFHHARTLQQQTAAAALDPGNYRLRWLVGSAWLARGQREIGCPHARAAGAQFPYTAAAQRLARRCTAS